MITSAEFGKLNQEEQIERIQSLGLSALHQFGVQPSEVEPLAHFENTTFYVKSDTGEFNLRVSRPGNQTDAALGSEITFLAALRSAGFRVPEPYQARYLITSDPLVPEPRQVVLFRWMHGEFLREHLGPNEASLIGEAMAKLHEFASTWSVPPDFSRHHIHSWAARERPSFQMDQPIEGLDEADRQMMIELEVQARRTIGSLEPSPDVYGLIHSDLHVGNILLEDGQLNIIDFDDCGYGYHYYDFAAALAFHLSDANFEELKEAMLQGYEEMRPLPPRTRELLNDFIRLRLAGVGRWILDRTDNPKLREIGPQYVHQFCEGLRKLA